jgi:hypothetical protein
MPLGAAFIITVSCKALIRLGGLPAYQTLSNSEGARLEMKSETAGANFRRREGNNPDRQLRSPNNSSVDKDVKLLKQPGGWLRSSHPLKSA